MWERPQENGVIKVERPEGEPPQDGDIIYAVASTNPEPIKIYPGSPLAVEAVRIAFLYDFLERGAAADSIVNHVFPLLGQAAKNYSRAYSAFQKAISEYATENEPPESEQARGERLFAAVKALDEAEAEQKTEEYLKEFETFQKTAKALLGLYNQDPDKFLSTDRAELLKIAQSRSQETEEIENLVSILPENHIIPNNKLANSMTKGIVDGGTFFLNISRKGKKPIETTCILSYEGESVTLSGKSKFTEYDRNVYNAVSSLFAEGNNIVTPATVYRAMTSMTETEKPTDKQIEAVTDSLDKMRFIRAHIDCTKELEARKITLNSKQINGGEIDTYLLAADAIKVRAGGQTVKAYRIIKPPILYEYSAAVKQVLTVPANLLDIKELDSKGNITTRSISNTTARIALKGYLLRRIEGIKGKNSLSSPVISLFDYERDGRTHQGLYSIAGKPDPDRKEMQRIRADAEKMLSYWTASGYIKGFTALAERKKITGYKINV